MDRKRICTYVLLAEGLILFMLGVLLTIQWKKNKNLDLSVMDWKSDFIEYDDINGWYVDDKLIQQGEIINVVCGPDIPLKRGTYRVAITYHCDYDQSCLACVEGKTDFRLKTGEVNLGRNFDNVSYDFEVREDIEDFELLFRYNGKGYFQITDVAIAPTSMDIIRNICIFLALSVCVDLCLLLWDRIRENRNTILTLCGIIFLTSLPVFMDGIAKGHDLSFHLMRIEGIAEEIHLGNLPVRLISSYIDGYGYPVSIYYGDILLYFPALMRLVGFSVMEVYKFYVLMINAGTAVITYLCMKHAFQDKKIALLTCLAYCTSSYRLVNLYERAAMGEYSAMMFMPVVAVAVYKIYTDNIFDYMKYRKNAYLLALGMSGLIGTHVLSTQMAVLMIAVICLSLYRLTFRKNTLKVFLQAMAGTYLLSAYFIIPFLDYFINVPIKVGTVIKNGGMNIQKWGLALGEYFTFFRDVHNEGLECANERMLLSPGIILMASLVIAVVLWVNGYGNRVMRALVVYTCLVMALTLAVFPWDFLQAYCPFGDYLVQVQFPWRYVQEVVVLLTLLLGSLLKQVSEDCRKMAQSSKVIVLVCSLMTCFFVGNYMDYGSFVTFYDGAELDDYSVGYGEYLRSESNRMNFSQNITSEVYSENMEEVSVISRRGSSMELRCVATQEGGFMWLPLFHYKGYHATDENGVEYLLSDGDEDRIKLSLPAGFDGTVRIEYKEPWYWRFAEIVSALSVLGACIWFVRKSFYSSSSVKY